MPTSAWSDAFDKVARMLDIPFNGASSGGEALEKYVAGVHPSPSAFANLSVPAPGELRFSYSGLKSAVKRYSGPEAEPNGTSSLPDGQKRELAAAFQAMAVRQLEEKTALALKAHAGPKPSSLVISGGVASNAFLRQR
jgi:N6-L-threonylcarbamoyladenine synthase